MKPFFLTTGRSEKQGGFSLVETALSIGLLSFGVLSLAPLLELGLKSARMARDDRESAQIAQMLVEEVKQGTLTSGMLYLDSEGNTCDANQAAYLIQAGSSSVTPTLTRETLQVTPRGAPDRVRTYVVVIPAAP